MLLARKGHRVLLLDTVQPHDGISTAYAPRRTVLDKILVDAARAAGAEGARALLGG